MSKCETVFCFFCKTWFICEEDVLPPQNGIYHCKKCQQHPLDKEVLDQAWKLRLWYYHVAGYRARANISHYQAHHLPLSEERLDLAKHVTYNLTDLYVPFVCSNPETLALDRVLLTQTRGLWRCLSGNEFVRIQQSTKDTFACLEKWDGLTDSIHFWVTSSRQEIITVEEWLSKVGTPDERAMRNNIGERAACWFPLDFPLKLILDHKAQAKLEKAAVEAIANLGVE